nr:hypothetical protein Iba_chr11bCG8280 [Ipomoea batatas]
MEPEELPSNSGEDDFIASNQVFDVRKSSSFPDFFLGSVRKSAGEKVVPAGEYGTKDLMPSLEALTGAESARTDKWEQYKDQKVKSKRKGGQVIDSTPSMKKKQHRTLEEGACKLQYGNGNCMYWDAEGEERRERKHRREVAIYNNGG